MNVLFLTVSTGQGHTSCGKALETCLIKGGASTYFLDLYSYIHPFLGKAISEIYLLASGKTPKLYGKYYDKEDFGRGKVMNVVSNFNRIIKSDIIKYIKANKIDVVICTHLFSGQVMTLIKDVVNTVNIGIVTDYTIHPKWEMTSLDYYVLADASLDYLAKKKGLPEDRLLPFGIPVDLKFAQKHDKSEMRKKLGFSNGNLIFVMMGSMGYGNIGEILNEIEQSSIKCEVAVVCGNNKKAKIMVENNPHKFRCHCYGFVNNVDEFMDAADCIITKPGGLSVTESLAKKLPMIFVDPIPGQEDRNVEFLVNNGVGLNVSKSFCLASALHLFFDSEIRRKEINEAIARISKPYAAEKLCDFIFNLEEVKDRI